LRSGGITEANLSILRSGKAKGIRFGTVNRICYFLSCDVGDILKFTAIWKKTMKRRFIILSCFLVLAFIIGLTDISLAARTENSRGETENDKLIGVYITTEYLDLFDYTGYLRDNYENANGKIIMEGNNDSYQGRLYAKLIEKTIINEDGSETAARPEYVFEGVEGFPYYCYNTVDEHGSCSTIKGDEAVSDGHNYVGSTDEGSSVTLEGIIYMSPRKIIGPYYLNPVYQTEDGRIYMVSGSGTSMSGDNTEGSSCSQSLDESKT
jgi:hypothetical protein